MVIRLWLWVSVKLQRQWSRWASVLPTIWAANTCYNTAHQIKTHLHPFQNKISQSIKQNLKNKLKDSFPIARGWIYISCVHFCPSGAEPYYWGHLTRRTQKECLCFILFFLCKRCCSLCRFMSLHAGVFVCVTECVWEGSGVWMINDWCTIENTKC